MSCPHKVLGSLTGTLVGDALGLPYEGLSPRRAARLLGPPDRHRLVFGRGMISDDGEHAIMASSALAASGGAPDRFGAALAWQLRFWFAALPAGLGWGTLRACIKLWLGFPPHRSGVWSAGNGPCMRAPVIGAASSSIDQVHELSRVSTLVTHRDPRAVRAAFAVALAAHLGRSGVAQAPEYRQVLRERVGSRELDELVRNVAESVANEEPTEAFAARRGMRRGVSGYCNDTLLICLHAWSSHPEDYTQAVTTTIRCGGDADTTAAIVGGVVGARVGAGGIQRELVEPLLEWPWTWPRIRELATSADKAMRGAATPRPATGAHLLLRLPRNLLFLGVVLGLGFRRLLPPY